MIGKTLSTNTGGTQWGGDIL